MGDGSPAISEIGEFTFLARERMAKCGDEGRQQGEGREYGGVGLSQFTWGMGKGLDATAGCRMLVSTTSVFCSTVTVSLLYNDDDEPREFGFAALIYVCFCSCNVCV